MDSGDPKSKVIEAESEGVTVRKEVGPEESECEIDWDQIPQSDKAMVRIVSGDETFEVYPIVVARHRPPKPTMISPKNGDESGFRILFSWEELPERDVDGCQYRLLAELYSGQEWKVIEELNASSQVALVDCPPQGDALAVRLRASSEAGEACSGEAVVHIRLDGQVIIDTRPPEVDVSWCLKNGKICFSFEESGDATGVATMRIKRGQEDWMPWQPFSPCFEMEAGSDGVSMFQFQFADQAGNIAPSAKKGAKKILSDTVTCCSDRNGFIMASSGKELLTPSGMAIQLPYEIRCLGSYKGQPVACCADGDRTVLFQVEKPPAELWGIPNKVAYMAEAHGTLYLGCEDGALYSYANGSGYLCYLCEPISSMCVVEGSLVIGSGRGLTCFNGTTWEKA